MKILSSPEGDGLLTNVEVHEWLKEKKFETERRDVPEGVIKPPSATASISKQVRKYIETSPAGNVSMGALRRLVAKLEKFKLSSVEMVMIANIRPEAYAHLTPLIVDAYSRYNEDQLYEMLGIINETLEKRTKPTEWNSEDIEENEAPMEDVEMNGRNVDTVQEAVEGINSAVQDVQAAQPMVKQEVRDKTEDTIQAAVNMSGMGPS